MRGRPETSSPAYRFSDLTLDIGRRSLERGGEPIELGKLTYALLVALVESAPNVVSHEELVLRVWDGRLTSPETVTQRVKLLRDALHDDAEQPRYVGVVRGQGYRLIPPVEQVLKARRAQIPLQQDIVTPPLPPPVPEPPPVAAAVMNRHGGALTGLAAVLLLAVAAAAYFGPRRASSPPTEPSGAAAPRDFEITQLTTTGRAVTPAISPDGKYVVYAENAENRVPTSLWVRQIATSANVQVLPPDGVSAVGIPTVSPDGNYIDFMKFGERGAELWRMPFLGGTPRRLRDAVTPTGWSPDGKSQAFVRSDALGNTVLVTVNERGEERVRAARTVPAYFVSLNIVGNPVIRPAWSPDGRVIAVADFIDVLTQRITFVDTATGAESSLDSRGSFVPGGLGWLGPSTLVLSQPEVFGQQAQLWRMTYPGGTIEPLTNDLSNYFGIDLDASRTRLVTTRLDTRTSVWIGDAAGGDAEELVPPAPFGGTNVFMSWAGKRLLYDASFGRRAVIGGIVPGSAGAEEVVPDAFHVAASPDGGTIVFGSAMRGRDGLWKVDASGGQPVQLVSGFAVEPSVTPDGMVVFVSNRNGVQSPWIVPLDGGDATEIVAEHASALGISADGRRLGFATLRPVIVVCELPRCSNRLELPLPANFSGALLHWTPDGTGLAYTAFPGADIWVAPLDGGTPHALTTFEPGSRIAQFAWSRDGGRLAFIRTRQEFDVVLLSGLRP